jgi:hypothetical protein
MPLGGIPFRDPADPMLYGICKIRATMAKQGYN